MDFIYLFGYNKAQILISYVETKCDSLNLDW